MCVQQVIIRPMKLAFRIYCFLVVASLLSGCGQKKSDEGYVGSRSCIECHKRFYHLWDSSYHGKAMQPYTDNFAVSNLTAHAEAIDIDGVKYQANISAGKGYVTEKGPKGAKKYPIEHVMGGKNVFFFLTPLERGRLQVMPISYRVITKEWYDTTASMVRHFDLEEDEAVHWTDRLLTFNTACFNCHVSQLRKNYDLATDSYKTVWGEPGINCETCHGPCEDHNRVFREAKGKETQPDDLHLLSWKTLSAEQRNDACSGCHAKAASITMAFVPGEKFFDHYDLTCLEDRDFYPDGRDLGENYTLTSWMMSPCVKSGKLDCIHCHTSSGRYRFAKENHNGACLPCHDKRVADIKSHSHHKTDNENSPTCVGCHMPLTTFGNMNRSDHSMRPPSPASSIEFKSPNSCVMCHDKKDDEWAAEKVAEWHPERRWSKRIVDEGKLVRWARAEKWEHFAEMLEYLEAEDSDVIVIASLVRLLAPCPDQRKIPALRTLLKHKSPLVRASTAVTIGGFDVESVRALLPLLDDEYRLVRIRAANALMNYQRNLLPMAVRKRFEEVEKELVESMESQPDQWSSHYNFGNYWGQRGDLLKSIASYETAIKLRSDVIMPYVNASIAVSQTGDGNKAYQYLQKAYELEPKNVAVNMNMGLLMAERGDMIVAEKHLRVAVADCNSMPQAAYNLAVIVGEKNPAEAVELCKKAMEAVPGNQKYQQALMYYMSKLPK